MSSRYPSSFAKSLAVLVCFSLLTVPVLPFDRRGNNDGSTMTQVQSPGAIPRPGAPEGTFPNIDEVKVRPPARPRAPLNIPSTLRAKRKPLVSRNGRRVGDPFPTPSQFPSPLASPLPPCRRHCHRELRLCHPHVATLRFGHFDLEPSDLPAKRRTASQ